ncbi:MAG: Fpg/Nei family DNA glycosylase [Bacteriovoracaceae bacterium]
MPELPEVETYRKQIEKKFKNKKITGVTASPDKVIFGLSTSAQIKKAFLGHKIKKAGRKGKYMWLELDQKPWPVFHLGMTGSYILADKIPEKAKSIKLILEFDDGSVLVFKDPRRFGRMFLVKDPFQSYPLGGLGPDALAETPSLKNLKVMFEGRSAPIKALLMDQSLISGIGNYMADEILFQARIDPRRKAGSLTSQELSRIRSKIISVSKIAVKANADSDKFPKNWLFHHRWGKKAGHVSSGETIRHTEVGGRTTAWVPELQH